MLTMFWIDCWCHDFTVILAVYIGSVQRITLNASYMTISGVEEPNNSIYSAASLALRVIFSDSDVELIRFFHEAIHLHRLSVPTYISLPSR